MLAARDCLARPRWQTNLATCEVCVGESAIADRDTVALTVWLDTLTALVAENNELLKGKAVVDPTNPLKLDANGMLQLGRPQRSQLPLSPYDVSSATSSCSGSHCSSPSATRSRGVGWRSPLSATPRF